MRRLSRIAAAGLAAVCLALPASPASAFTKDGCGSGECKDCHALSRDEAVSLLGGLVDNVLFIGPAPVKGLWEIAVVKQGQRWPVYIDFSKKHLLNAQIINVRTRENVTDARVTSMNKVDAARIPLADALVVGNPKAKRKVIVFSDPDCHYCGMLHKEIRKVVEKDRSVAFFIKLYSRTNNPTSVEKAAAVICGKSLDLLEDAYAGKKLPPATCKTTSPADSFALAQTLRITGTPTLVLPDGTVLPGYRDADALLALLKESPKSAPKTGSRK